MRVETWRGSAAELHALDPFQAGPVDGPVVAICAATAPAIVLGSRQTPDLLDLAACERAGLDVVRRRSGGGAVVVRPGEIVWIDVVLPHGVAPDDVRGSMVWVGDRWIDALGALTDRSTTRLERHDGGMVATAWADLVCFAGFGPGEVLTAGRKLVGLSQRRTRHGLRIQCQVHRRARLASMPALFGVPTPSEALTEPATLTDVGLGTDADVDAERRVADREIASALADAIERRSGGNWGRMGGNG